MVDDRCVSDAISRPSKKIKNISNRFESNRNSVKKYVCEWGKARDFLFTGVRTSRITVIRFLVAICDCMINLAIRSCCFLSNLWIPDREIRFLVFRQSNSLFDRLHRTTYRMALRAYAQINVQSFSHFDFILKSSESSRFFSFASNLFIAMANLFSIFRCRLRNRQRNWQKKKKKSRKLEILVCVYFFLCKIMYFFLIPLLFIFWFIQVDFFFSNFVLLSIPLWH